MRRVFTRDHIIWSLTFAGAVLTFVVTSTTHLVPDAYVGAVKDAAVVCGFVSGLLGRSPLPGRE